MPRPLVPRTATRWARPTRGASTARAVVLTDAAGRTPAGRWARDLSEALARRPGLPLRLLAWDEGELPLARTAGTRVVADLAAAPAQGLLEGRPPPVAARRWTALRWRSLRAACRRFDRAVVVEGAPAELDGLVPPTSRRVPWAVDAGVGPFPVLTVDAPARRAARARLGIDDGVPVVAGFGGQDWRGGADRFLRTALLVAERVPGLHLLWVGPDPFAFPVDELVRFDAARPALAGRLAHVDVGLEHLGALDAADLVLCTAREGAPDELGARAAARGLPVLADRDSLPRGLTTAAPRPAPGRAGELAVAAEALLTRPADRAAAGRAAHEAHGLPAVLARVGLSEAP